MSVEIGAPAADGSGGVFAIAAMMVGASAFRAVEVACQLDVGCGGPVQCFDFNSRKLTGPFGLSSERAGA